MDTAQNSGAPGTSQALSQPPHLCQACLSVLERDNLELKKVYPHHATLQAFIEACYTGCYLCSNLLSKLDIDDQENLMLLAEGKVPDTKLMNKMIRHWVDPSEFTEKYPDPVERSARFQEVFGEPTSWVSFTMMDLTHWLPWSGSPQGNYIKIQIQLNPMYEAYIPPHLNAYRSSLKTIWQTVHFDWIKTRKPALVITQQEFRELGITEDLPSHTGSRETWATVEGWLRECSEKHQCLTKANKNWYPTRLVERLSDDMFRVVRSDSSSFNRERGYITLSHRWGNGDFARLTTENISALTNGQPITMLRKIFQEALLVAKKINIPYVWIDSLCIIQAGDDFADWRKESTTMAEVYSNSRCNISADWGDDYNGLFFERDDPLDRPCSINLRVKSPETGDNTSPDSETPPDGVPSYIVLYDRLTEDVLEAPLNRRGWVAQERLLAPRVLHFTPQQVSWECGQKLTFEKIEMDLAPLGLAPWDMEEIELTGPYNRLVSQLNFNDSLRQRMRRLNLHQAQKGVDWSRIVDYYCACGLTKQQDVLVAIAGIARRLCPVVKDIYVAGLWAKSLPTTLLWQRSARKENCRLPTEYFAPTFSWAASDGEILLGKDEDFQESKIIASAVFIKHRTKSLPCAPAKGVRAITSDEILTDHVFGPLASPEAEVRMRGVLRSCSRVPPDPDVHSESQPLFTPACPSTHAKDPDIETRRENGTVMDVFDDRGDPRDGDAGADLTAYYYTIIETSLRPPLTFAPSAEDTYNVAAGLFLRSVDASMGRFERVGRVHYERSRGNADILKPLGNERDLPAWSYDEAIGEHTFYIV